MESPVILPLQETALHHDPEQPSALDRLQYLCPSRYFRFYMLYERMSHQTCWLPEGFDV